MPNTDINSKEPIEIEGGTVLEEGSVSIGLAINKSTEGVLNTTKAKPRKPREAKVHTYDPKTHALIEHTQLEALVEVNKRLEKQIEMTDSEAMKLAGNLQFKNKQVEELTSLIRDLIIKRDVETRDINRALDGIGITLGGRTNETKLR